MKTERDKAFEKYVMSLERFKNRRTVFVFQLDENDDYENRDVYDLHHAWQASAQREGYKLVASGDTGVAALNTNRKFIGIEMDEGYFNTAKDRLAKTQEGITP